MYPPQKCEEPIAQKRKGPHSVLCDPSRLSYQPVPLPSGGVRLTYAFIAAGMRCTVMLLPSMQKPTGTAHLPDGMSAYLENTPAALPR